MKVITVKRYISEDGIEFEKEEDCIAHEKILKIDLEEVRSFINDFLSDTNNYDFEIDKEHTHFCSVVGRNFRIEILTSKNGNELDENFFVDFFKWNEFNKIFTEKYGKSMNYPYYYWGK